MIDKLIRTAGEDALFRVWLISDLQQSDPRRSRECMYIAYDDFKELGLGCDKIWYLGDSVEGSNEAHLADMTKMQEQVLLEIGAPVCYCPGNHDMDLLAERGIPSIPFRDMIKSHADLGWKTTENVEDFYFWDSIGDIDVLFIADHAARDGEWRFCHGRPFGNNYPHTKEEIARLLEERKSKKKVITASHYAYPGGNRGTEYMGEYLPPDGNMLLHVYGHAHIGDGVWAGKDWGRQICGTDNSPLTQVNISSLEYGRGNAVRSAFLEVYPDSRLGVFFRNHQQKRWEKLLIL